MTGDSDQTISTEKENSMFDKFYNKVFLSEWFQFLLNYGFLLLGLGLVMLAYGIGL